MSALLMAVFALLVWSPAPATAEKRVALVIGNAGYTSIPKLNNPGNDAALMTETLKSVGFEVISATDVDIRGMRRAIRRFGRRLRAAGRDAVGLFYYSGHGVQARGQNYLIPLKADIASEYDFDIEAMSASNILGQMESAGNRLNIVILDACRDNPFGTRTKSLSKGFARMSAPSGSLIAFATAPGRTAADGDGRNSPYTAALAKAMLTPGLQVELVFKKVRVAVETETNNRQTPWEQSSLKGDFFFVPEAKKPKPVPQPVTSSIERDFDLARSIGTKQAWEAFLVRHGEKADSFHVQLAKAALKKLAVGVFPKPEPVRQKPKVGACEGVLTTVAGKKRCLKHGEVFRDCPDCPEMVVIPPGTFMMGSLKSELGRDENEGPRREVTVGKAFAVGKFEVTVDQFSAFVGATGYEVGDSCWTYVSGDWKMRQGRSYLKPGFEQSGSHPAACLSWNDAQAYVKWLGKKTGQTYRLLSEAEWEYAARAGTQTPFSTGARITTDQANFNGNFTYNGSRWGPYRKRTVAVGSFAANAFGLHDMHGNVWEWVQDCYKNSYEGASKDGKVIATGSCGIRVLRGGSWDDYPWLLRSAYRLWFRPNVLYYSGGFRLSRALAP